MQCAVTLVAVMYCLDNFLTSAATGYAARTPLQILQRVQKDKDYFRGHNFCWDSQTPEYVTNITDPTELKAVLKEHIDAVMGRYGKYFYAFDVINEREFPQTTKRQ